MATHCLHVGINDYRGPDSDLAGCVNDARDDARIFGRRRRGTARDAIDECPFFGAADSQVVLLDRQATLTRILGELIALLRKLEKGDWGIFTFSGHGTYVRDLGGDEVDGQDEALVCWDRDPLVDDRLATLFQRRAQASRVLVFTDSCFSGTNLRSIGPRMLGPSDPNERYRFLPPVKLQPKSRSARGAAMKQHGQLIDIVHQAACRDNQFAADTSFDGRPAGAWTHYRNEALCELAPGATFGEWCERIATKLPNDRYDQVPQVNAFQRALDWTIPLRK